MVPPAGAPSRIGSVDGTELTGARVLAERLPTLPWRMVDLLSGSRERLQAGCPPPRPLARQQATPLPAGTLGGKAGLIRSERSVCCSGCCRAGRAGRDADWAPGHQHLSSATSLSGRQRGGGRHPNRSSWQPSSTDLSESTQADRPRHPAIPSAVSAGRPNRDRGRATRVRAARVGSPAP